MSENKSKNRISSRESSAAAVSSPPTPSAAANQWIEILEPKTKVQMFANLIT
jgi:hypothetical protein